MSVIKSGKLLTHFEMEFLSLRIIRGVSETSGESIMEDEVSGVYFRLLYGNSARHLDSNVIVMPHNLLTERVDWHSNEKDRYGEAKFRPKDSLKQLKSCRNIAELRECKFYRDDEYEEDEDNSETFDRHNENAEVVFRSFVSLADAVAIVSADREGTITRLMNQHGYAHIPIVRPSSTDPFQHQERELHWRGAPALSHHLTEYNSRIPEWTDIKMSTLEYCRDRLR